MKMSEKLERYRKTVTKIVLIKFKDFYYRLYGNHKISKMAKISKISWKSLPTRFSKVIKTPFNKFFLQKIQLA